MPYQRGDRVEVIMKEEGFMGSYFPANIISQISNKDYIVQYRTLLTEDGSGPLREVLSTNEIRPKPPDIVATDYRLKEVVDAYAQDGWWVGKVIKKKGLKYLVHFESANEKSVHPLSMLRVHQEWKNDSWVYSKK